MGSAMLVLVFESNRFDSEGFRVPTGSSMMRVLVLEFTGKGPFL